MRRLLTLILLLLICDFLLEGCANPKSPSGGPKDTIPPSVIESYPSNGAINFNSQEIEITFSEYINADKLKDQLIITPKTDNSYKSLVKKNKLILKFDNPFNESTTYNLNFADGVTDITEKNPSNNLSIAFSTGNYIDSMSITGNVEDLFEKTPSKGYTIGLYPDTDTLDYFTDQPIYFTTTNDSGHFRLTYLKKGIYKLLAFEDENKNILLDPETESHGFISDQLIIDSIIYINEPIRTVLQNIKPLELINSRPAGKYVEVKFNKTIDQYSVKPEYLNHNLIGETRDIIRIYKPDQLSFTDTLETFITASDSLFNQTADTVKIVFLESNRKASSFSYRIQLLSESLVNNQSARIFFNKPVQEVDTSLIRFQYDSLYDESSSMIFKWNHNRTILEMISALDKEPIKQLIAHKELQDSTVADLQNEGIKKSNLYITKSMYLNMLKGAFVSIESDTSKTQGIKIPFSEPTSFGTIKFSLSTKYENFTLQLLDTKGRVAYQSKNLKEITIPKIKPGNYKIRVLIDQNNDDRWSAGNLLKNEEPELVYLFPEGTSVRENWILELPISF